MRSLTRDKDTVCALATAHGIGAISVIRISGPKAAEIIRKIAAFLPENLESHKIYYGILKSVEGEPLDEVLVSFFANGRSFTGEASFEISCHGSESIVNLILENLVRSGARPAERGEFTYRAYMNGRLDLVQAESVLSLIESRSKRATSMALRQLQGDLSKRLKSLVDQLTWILAQLEANIDFASEDIEIASGDLLTGKTENLLKEVEGLLATHSKGRMIQSGMQVLLVG
jgi:tRNA modification GTPase